MEDRLRSDIGQERRAHQRRLLAQRGQLQPERHATQPLLDLLAQLFQKSFVAKRDGAACVP